jgi:GNAT superfamily N-acetyltransferase
MTMADVTIEPLTERSFGLAVRFLRQWVTEREAGAREHLADHASGGGTSFLALLDDEAAGIVTIRWRSDYAGFRDLGIPLVHQIAVAGAFRRHGIATALMDAAEDCARERGITALGITVGLFDEYGPAQRMYAQRGYIPDGRGACRGQHPLTQGTPVTMDHDLIIWLTKDLRR